jgi:hypothetical protein
MHYIPSLLRNLSPKWQSIKSPEAVFVGIIPQHGCVKILPYVTMKFVTASQKIIAAVEVVK